MYRWWMILWMFFHLTVCCQEESINISQRLENETAGADDREPEDDVQIQLLEYHLRHRMNINQVSPEWMLQVLDLSKMQVMQFENYRKWLGPFLDLMELQAVPGWDAETVRRVLPFLKLGEDQFILPVFRERVRKGEHSFLLRTSRVLEKSSGFLKSDSGIAPFTGDRQKLMLRYTYRFRNLLQWGITAEKDAGEPLIKKGYRKGFDFYSAHLAIRDFRFIKALMIGDYHVNMGQGLIHWQSMAFGRSAETIHALRQGQTLRSYNGTDENRFHRGLGIELAKKSWSISLFYASDKMDGNLATDTGLSAGRVLTSFQTSGLHRTDSEIMDKDAFRQKVIGGRLGFRKGRLNMAVNGLQYFFSETIQRKNEPYNLFSVTGKRWSNYSVDYGYTFKNVYVFGELASDKNRHHAVVQGLLASLHPTLDISVVYRHISPAYRSFNANAFTENREPQNERGIYTGLSWRPVPGWRLDFYADHFHFPWLAYRVDRPATGQGYLAQLGWKPNKKSELYVRFQQETKSNNHFLGNTGLNILQPYTRTTLRWQSSFAASSSITIRSRLDLSWYDQLKEHEQGFMTFLECLYKAFSKPYSIIGRLAWFQTDGYNSRVYAYEQDVLYYYSISSFFDSGLRAYVVYQQDVHRNWRFWVKIATSLYADNESIGSDLTEIKGNRKSSIQFQLQYRF